MKAGLAFFSIGLIVVLLSSCVGNRKLVYLQDKTMPPGDERYFPEVSIEQQRDTYLLRSGDVLHVNIEKFRVGEELFTISNFQQLNRNNLLQHPYLSGYKISSDGYISLPLLGSVQAAGKSLEMLQSELSKLAAKEYPDAVVEVFQLDGTVSVVGEVRSPGRYPLYKRYNSIFDIIAMAGDLGPYADRENIRILRITAMGQEVNSINLNDVNALTDRDFLVQNDDVIIISPLKRKKYVTTNIQWAISAITALVAVSSLVLNISR